MYCARTDDPADDFRSKIMERLLVDFVPRLSRLSKSREGKSGSYGSYVDVIVALANFGRLIHNFVLCKD